MELASKSKSPLVSVIVPVFNVEDYLERCIDSILDQTYSNLEVILINDGSVDASGEICDRYAQRFSNIIVIHQTNGGMSSARNAGLERCKGDFISFVDSDDWLKPKMIERLLKFAIQHQLNLVECGVQNSRTLSNEMAENKTCSIIENQTEAMSRLLNETNYSVWRRIYDRRLLEDLRFIPGKINEDVFFTIDCINKIEKQGYIHEQLYIYNTENTSITRSHYSLKKIEAKDALHYPVSQTLHYNNNIKKRANYLLLRGLILHYQRILLHPHLDNNHKLRKEFKKEVVDQLTVAGQLHLDRDIVWYKALIIKYTPIFLYKLFLQLNQLRIKLKQ